MSDLIDDHMTDYQEGSVIFDIAVSKMANGMFKASGMGLESNHHDQSRAVLDLQDKLQTGLRTGAIRPTT